MSELKEPEGFKLPTKKTAPTQINPRTMVIFAARKVGKSTALAELEDNLILDGEGGTDFLTALKTDISDLDKFDNVCRAFATSGAHYKYITIDTVTSLVEKLINQLAVRTYNKEEGENKDINWDIEKLAYGKGHMYKKESLRKIIDFFQKYCDTLIIVGHIADKHTTSQGNLVKELDLPGGMKNILGRNVDAIGYMSKDLENPNINLLSFVNSEEVMGGTRALHLRGKQIIVSELVDEKIITHWDKIFIDNK